MSTARRTIFEVVLDAAADLGMLGGISAIYSRPPLSVGADVPSTEERLIGMAIAGTGRECCKKGMLIEEHSFYTVSGTQDYQIPSDYYLPLTGTTWNTSDKTPLQHVSQRRWQSDRSGFIASSVDQTYRIRQLPSGAAGTEHNRKKKMAIEPTPTGAEKILFNYRSDHFIENSSTVDDVDDVTLNSNDPVVITAAAHGLVDGQVIFLYGLPTEFPDSMNNKTYTVSNKDTNTFELLGTNSEDVTSPIAVDSGNFYVVSNTLDIATDTYFVLPNDLMELGISYRLRRRMGLAYFDHKAEYEDELEAHVGAQHGDHVINMGGSRITRPIGIPDGNFTQS